MQRNEIVGAADSLADVAGLLTDTTRDMHQSITGRGFAHTARLLGPLVRPVKAVHDAVTTATYATVRTGLSAAITAGGRVVAALRADGASVMDTVRGGHVVGVVNGVIGDRLARQANPLALEMTLRHEGRTLPVTPEALAAAYPGGEARIAVYLPGLCETEAVWYHRAEEWHPDDGPTHGDRLHDDLGLVPLWVRYNSGRRVSENGADLDALLEAVTRHWPVPIQQIVFVGYSMGGLVARSALHHAAERAATWPQRVSHVVSLGSPHHGAPMEKLGNATTWALSSFAHTRALGSFFNQRSSGIKDLRYGNVTDADWRGYDPDALLRDTRVGVPATDGIAQHAVGAVMGGRLGSIFGDGMVRLSSATGRHPHRPLAFQSEIEMHGLSHFALRNHPVVYGRLRALLAADPPAPTPAQISLPA